jgi:dethiobiotin synthetase
MRGFFVTGTGTEVGKTIVAAVIARELAAGGARVAVFKPAVSGLDEAVPGGADHELLRLASGSEQSDDEISPHRYGLPVSPHLAAEMAGETIEPTGLVEAARAAGRDADALVAEGVGGIMVPLTLGYLVRDFARELALPVVIVASPGLGTINHSLLTVEAARAVGLEVAAVVLTPWPDEPEAIHESNREAIARLGDVEVLTVTQLDPADPASWPVLGLGKPL